MDIERMHEMVESLTEYSKKMVDCGTSDGGAVDIAPLSELVDMIKDLSESMYHRVLTETMLDSDTEEIMDMFDRYGEDRRYYNHYHYKNGRFAPKGSGTRRGYEEPYYHMTPEMMREHSPEWYRDMDREKYGLMYYTEPSKMPDSSMRDSREGRSGMSRRAYMETKEIHKDNTAEAKQAKMKELEKYMSELSSDITDMIGGSSQEERNLLKQKLQVLTQKIS